MFGLFSSANFNSSAHETNGAAGRWTEAAAAPGWREQWPNELQYLALRKTKTIFDLQGPRTQWCQCGKHCAHDIQNNHAVRVGDTDQIASVERADNRYGYESGIYINPCDYRVARWIMRWDGVPLLVTDVPVREPVHIVRQQRIHNHALAPVHVHHDHWTQAAAECAPTVSRFLRR